MRHTWIVSLQGIGVVEKLWIRVSGSIFNLLDTDTQC